MCVHPLRPMAHCPFYRYVVREQGKVEIGVLSCGMCHTRVMPDGTVIKGAQGNIPLGRATADDFARGFRMSRRPIASSAACMGRRG